MTEDIGDRRGVLRPELLPRFTRLAPPEACADLVRWFWFSEWEVPAGQVSRQHIIGFPASNLVVEHDLVGVSGPTTRASHRDLVGTGWAVGALLRPAAVPSVVGEVEALRDDYETRELPDLHRAVAAHMGQAHMGQEHAARDDGDRSAAAEAFGGWLVDRVGALGDEQRLANALAEEVDTDPSLPHLDDVALRLGVSTRTVQRLARRYVGLPPAAMIRRRRLQEAALTLREDPETDLAELAADLGYADQSHLHRDFARVLRLTPARYRDEVRPEA